MLAELRKHASTSKHLRELALQKTAGVIGRKAADAGAWMLANPAKTVVLGLSALAAKDKARREMSLMDPAVHRHQLGMDQ